MSMSTKDKIIEVLADLIKHDENISEISISKIAELADIGKSTVYEHFSSKEDLIKEAYCYLSEHYRKRILAPLQHQTFELSYKELTSRIIKSAREANELVMSILNEGHSVKMMPKKDVEQIMEGIQKDVQKMYLDIIKKGVLEGIIHPNPSQTKEKSHVIRALTIGLTMQYINDKIDLSEDDALAYMYKYTVLVLNA